MQSTCLATRTRGMHDVSKVECLTTGEGNLEVVHSVSALCTLHMLRQSVRSVVQGTKVTRDVEAGSRLARTGSTLARIQVPAKGARIHANPRSRRIRRIRLRAVVKLVLAHLHILKRAIQQITRYPAVALTFWLAVT